MVKNTRYVALEFGIHGFMPYRVPEIVQRGFGDCKDKASLIYTMLREAGIDARIVLVRTRQNGAIDSEPASLSVFDHAIAYVPSLDLYLDGTAEHSGTRELPGGRPGRDGAAGRAQRRPSSSRRRCCRPRRTCARATLADRSSSADGSGTVQAHESDRRRRRRALPQHVPGRGHAQGSPRAPALQQPIRASSLEQHASRASTTSSTTSALNYRLKAPQVARLEGNELRIARQRAARPAARDGGAAPRASTRSISSVKNAYREERTMRAPRGFAVRGAARGRRGEEPFRQPACEQRAARQREVVSTTAFQLDVDRVEPADYPEFRRFIEQADEMLQQRIAFARESQVMSGMIRRCASARLLLVRALARGAGRVRRAFARAGESETSIDVLRKKAPQGPNDPQLWTRARDRRAPGRRRRSRSARESLAHAKKLGAQEPAALYVEAEEHVLEGQPELGASTASRELLERASERRRPARAAAGRGGARRRSADMNDAVDDYRPRMRGAAAELRPAGRQARPAAAHQLRMLTARLALQRGDLDGSRAGRARGRLRAEGRGRGSLRSARAARLRPDAACRGARAPSPRATTSVRAAVTRRRASSTPGAAARCSAAARTTRCPARASCAASSTVAEGRQATCCASSPPTASCVWRRRPRARARRPARAAGLRRALSAARAHAQASTSSRSRSARATPTPRSPWRSCAGTKATSTDVALPEPSDAAQRYLAAKVALARGNGVAARELLRELRAEEAERALARARGGGRRGRSAASGRAAARRGARALAPRRRSRTPRAWYPSVGLANLEAAEGRTKEAIDALREAAAALARGDGHPHQPDRAAARARLRRGGRPRRAGAGAAHAQRLRGGWHRAHLGAGARPHRPGGRAERARGRLRRHLHRALRRAQGAAQVRRGRHGARAPASLADPLDESQRIESELERAELSATSPQARALREERSELWRDRPGPVVDRADLLLAAASKRRAPSTTSAAPIATLSGRALRAAPRARGAAAATRCSRTSARTAPR